MPTFGPRPGPVSRTPARPIKRTAAPPGFLVPTYRQRLGRPLASDVPPLPDTPEGRLAGRVRQHRVDRRWSQAELASRMSELGHGWHQTTVAKTERAERDPRYPELIALAEALAVPLDALLGIASEPMTDAASESRLTIHRLEQEEQLLKHRVVFLSRDIDDMEDQRKEHLQRLSELKKEIAAARRTHKAAST